MPTKYRVNVKIAVLGDGGWGTTLAILLAQKKYAVTLWGAFPDYVSYLNKNRVNTKFLPGVRIPKNITVSADLQEAIRDAAVVVLATPSQYMRSVLKLIKKNAYPHKAIYLSVTKGIEIATLKRMSEIIPEELGKVRVAVLSGPTIAQEVAHRIPTAAVVAATDKSTAEFLQGLFMSEAFRVYVNQNLIGVELGGSLKNIIAIACGISDGLRFGTNTKAAILSRGLAEISRLGKAMGADVHTFSGISGLGDLVTTCISQQSRNRLVGEQIGKGKTLRSITRHMQMIAEGVPTAKSAHLLAQKYHVEMPITQEVYSVLHKNKSPLKAVRDLMTREKKTE